MDLSKTTSSADSHFIETQTQILKESSSYIKAYNDTAFLQSDAARELRLLAEYSKADIAFKKDHILSTVIVFGSARILPPEVANTRLQELLNQKDKNQPQVQEKIRVAREKVEMSRYYALAQEFGKIVTLANIAENHREHIEESIPHEYVICTGGGPGIMEAANRGAYDAGGISIGLNISLPYEQKPNPYITPEYCFQYHYFAMRKMHFLLRAKALVVFPGGFGTFDELFECLTLRQTGRMQAIPIIMFGKSFWERTINFSYLVETGVISPKDLELFTFVNTPEEAWDYIKTFFDMA